MTSRDFIYWLQGLFELSPNLKTLNAEQVDLIRKHLALVFIHEIDPSMGNKDHQKKLDKVHNPQSPKEYKPLEELIKEAGKHKENPTQPCGCPWDPYRFDQTRFNC